MLNNCRNPEEVEARRNSMIADYGTQVEWRIANLNEYGDIKSMVVDRKTFLGSFYSAISNVGQSIGVLLPDPSGYPKDV
jgi:hypothetical protein